VALTPPSVPRAIRALAEAHLRSSLNASLRDAGRVLTAVATLTTVLFALFATVPVVFGFGALGFFVANDSVDTALATAGWVFTLLPPAAGLLSMLNGDARSFDWPKLKGYPVAPLALFVAEVAASSTQVLVALMLLAQSALAAGLLAARPELAGRVLAALLTTLAARAVLATVASWLIRRVRMVVLLLAVLLPAPGLLLAFDPSLVARWAGRARQLSALTAFLPASLQLHALDASGPVTFALRLLGPFFIPLALFAVSFALAFREVEPAVAARRAPERLWSHSSRVLSLARLTLLSIWSCEVGRMQMLTPVLFALPVLLIRLQLSALLSSDLAFFIVWTLTPTMLLNLSLNQFGADRGAVKALLLLPISPRELLQGKALGLAAIALANSAVLTGVAFALVRPPLTSLLTGPLAGISLFLVGLTVGQFTSIAWPRPLPLKGLRAPQGGVVLGFISLGILFLVSAPTVLLSFWLQDDPWLLAGVLLLFAAASFSLFFGSTQLAVRFLVGRRERLVESLS
jgi:hypothetical protein